MIKSIFIDTSYILALVNSSDSFYNKAKTIAEELTSPLLTTEAVLTEIGNALSRLRWRKLAIEILNDLRNDSNITIIPVDSILFDKAITLYSSRIDKEWSLTDCISFIVMHDYDLTAALTMDKHFQQANFHALLLED